MRHQLHKCFGSYTETSLDKLQEAGYIAVISARMRLASFATSAIWIVRTVALR